MSTTRDRLDQIEDHEEPGTTVDWLRILARRARQSDPQGFVGRVPAVAFYEYAAAEIERLRAALDEAHLARIEAQNPGIDMDRVRHERDR